MTGQWGFLSLDVRESHKQSTRDRWLSQMTERNVVAERPGRTRRPKRLAAFHAEVASDWPVLPAYLWSEMQLTPHNADHPLAKPSALDTTGMACPSYTGRVDGEEAPREVPPLRAGAIWPAASVGVGPYLVLDRHVSVRGEIRHRATMTQPTASIDCRPKKKNKALDLTRTPRPRGCG